MTAARALIAAALVGTLSAPAMAAKHPPVPVRFTGTWTEARVACGDSEEVFETTIDQTGVYSEAMEASITNVRILSPTSIEIDTYISFEPPARGTSLLTLSRDGKKLTMRVVADGKKRLAHEDPLLLKRCPAAR